MRKLYIVILLVLLTAAGIFAAQNNEAMTVTFFNQTITCPCSLVIAAVYVLGMTSGWFVVALVRGLLRGAEHSAFPAPR
ncbi:MAG: LapA family protein [Gemmataceae bacterium]